MNWLSRVFKKKPIEDKIFKASVPGIPVLGSAGMGVEHKTFDQEKWEQWAKMENIDFEQLVWKEHKDGSELAWVDNVVIERKMISSGMKFAIKVAGCEPIELVDVRVKVL